MQAESIYHYAFVLKLGIMIRCSRQPIHFSYSSWEVPLRIEWRLISEADMLVTRISRISTANESGTASDECINFM